jgi:hypothetical protein
MAVDKELEKEVTDFVNKALLGDLPIPSPKLRKRSTRFVKSWRWVDKPRSKPKSGRST